MSKETLPVVTVLLTVYNGMPYLKEAVESILQQSMREFTFLILNNASTDGTEDYLDSLGDERLQIKHLKENIGRTGVLNLGLRSIITEYTAIIDADDIADPNRLQVQVDFLISHLEVAVVGSDIKYMDRMSNVFATENFPQNYEEVRNRMVVHNQLAHSACCFRTDIVRRLGGYPEEYIYAQDMALWITLLLHGYSIASIAEYLATIRLHADQSTRSSPMQVVVHEEHLNLVDLFLSLPKLPKQVRQAGSFRKSALLFKLGRYGSGLIEACVAFFITPTEFFYNQYLIDRFKVSVKRIKNKNF